jgi:hypothetical protein
MLFLPLLSGDDLNSQGYHWSEKALLQKIDSRLEICLYFSAEILIFQSPDWISVNYQQALVAQWIE